MRFLAGAFVEGARFPQEKLLATQEYDTMGLPSFRNDLIPRMKMYTEKSGSYNYVEICGFCCSSNHRREFVPAIYDLTFAFPKDSPPRTMLRLLKGQPCVVHVHIKRHLIKDLPATNEAVAQWCKNDFLVKVMLFFLMH